jgi:hypothetical protein
MPLLIVRSLGQSLLLALQHTPRNYIGVELAMQIALPFWFHQVLTSSRWCMRVGVSVQLQSLLIAGLVFVGYELPFVLLE